MLEVDIRETKEKKALYIGWHDNCRGEAIGNNP